MIMTPGRNHGERQKRPIAELPASAFPLRW